MKIVCLVDLYTDARQPLMIAEGLLQLNKNVVFNQDIWSLGEKLAEQEVPKKLKEDLLDCDLIFVPDFEHFGGGNHRPYHEGVTPSKEIWDFLNEKDLWSKIVVYDIKHEDEYPDILDKCLAYFKREYLRWEPDGNFGRFTRRDKRIRPLNLSIVSAYEKMFKRVDHTKVRDIGYFFNPAVLFAHGSHYNRRVNVMIHLHQAMWTGYDVQLTVEGWCSAINSHDPVSFPPKEDADFDYWHIFEKYYKLMANTKILIDAMPTRYVAPYRPWEVLASGSLCVLDPEKQEELEHPFEHGKHCLIYDSTSPPSIMEMIDQVKYYSKNDMKRERIAKAGLEHAQKYHKSINRVKKILESIK